MLKKLGVPMLALAAGLLAVPHQAKAGVRFGVYVGAPAYPYYAYRAPVYRYRVWHPRWHRWVYRRDWR